MALAVHPQPIKRHTCYVNRTSPPSPPTPPRETTHEDIFAKHFFFYIYLFCLTFFDVFFRSGWLRVVGLFDAGSSYRLLPLPENKPFSLFAWSSAIGSVDFIFTSLSISLFEIGKNENKARIWQIK